MPPKRDRKDKQTSGDITDNTRIAIVDSNRCKPKKCGLECKKSCPIVRMGKLCIEVRSTDKISTISEPLCIGCGICVKKCPFDAISIINLPANLTTETTHRYGANTFKLHRLPCPRPGQVLGLVGTNGIGKSTALQVLAGKLKLNLGDYLDPPDWETILRYFRGNELQNYFTKMIEDTIKAAMKVQYVDKLAKLKVVCDHTVRFLIDKKCEKSDKLKEYYLEVFELNHVLDRTIKDLSGGELQRFACCIVCVQDAEVYIFDEPSSYLDVKQRLRMAEAIRSLLKADNYVIVVEHDLSVLDYMSDFICCLYGTPGAYGVVTFPAGVREGINHFLDGFIPSENLRFRDTALKFKVSETAEREEADRLYSYEYPDLGIELIPKEKTANKFNLFVKAGDFTDSEIIVILGENGTGKTTFVKLLAGKLQPKTGGKVPPMNVSYKPQKVSPSFQGTVRQLLHERIPRAYTHQQFVSDVMKPMKMAEIIDRDVQTLSGGETQRVAIVICLGKPADVYLIDEPSAYLDSEQRLNAAKVIKRYIINSKKTAFIVEHDFIMGTYMADRVVVFEGEPGINCKANSPTNLLDGMNKFLSSLEITFRRDPNNYRPRINKKDSVKDTEQKSSGQYFFIED